MGADEAQREEPGETKAPAARAQDHVSVSRRQFFVHCELRIFGFYAVGMGCFFFVMYRLDGQQGSPVLSTIAATFAATLIYGLLMHFVVLRTFLSRKALFLVEDRIVMDGSGKQPLDLPVAGARIEPTRNPIRRLLGFVTLVTADGRSALLNERWYAKGELRRKLEAWARGVAAA